MPSARCRTRTQSRLSAGMALGILATALLPAAAGALGADSAPAGDPAGAWVGGGELAGAFVFLRLEVAAKPAASTLSVPQLGLARQPFHEIGEAGGALVGELELPVPPPEPGEPAAKPRLLRLEARRRGEGLEVVLELPREPSGESQRTQLLLSRGGEVSAEELDPWLGAYRMPGGESVLLGRWNTPAFVYLLKGEELVRLHPLADGAFLSTLGEAVERIDDDRGCGLLLRPREGGEAFLPRDVDYGEEEVTFAGDAGPLSGTLFLPPGPGPHPAVVLVHGSGPDTRQPYRAVAHLFASAGVAALFYDKRGTGESAGSWRRAGVEELARDALRGVELLRARPEVDPDGVGLWGISQGGWVLLRAGAESDAVAFLLPFSGATVSGVEQERFRMLSNLRDVSGSRWVEGAMEKLAQLSFDALAWGQASRWSDRLPVFDLERDPEQDLNRLRAPLLAVFGALDHLVPVGSSVRRYQAFKGARGGAPVEVAVFPGADHGLYLSRTGSRFETAVSRRYPPELWPLVLDWVRRVAAGEEPPAVVSPLPLETLSEEVATGAPRPGYGGLWLEVAWLLFLGLAFGGAVLGIPLMSLFRRRWAGARRSEQSAAPRDPEAASAGAGGWLVAAFDGLLLGGFLLLLERLWSVAGGEKVFLGALPLLLPALAVGAVLAAVAAVAMAVRVWARGLLSPLVRLLFTALALAAVAFVPFLAYWGVLAL